MLRAIAFFALGLALVALALILGFGSVSAIMGVNPMGPALGFLCVLAMGCGFACWASMGDD